MDGAQWAWMIHVGPGVKMRDLGLHQPRLILDCERQNVQDPLLLPCELRRTALVEWLEAFDVSMHGFPETSRPGAIDVPPDGWAEAPCTGT